MEPLSSPSPVDASRDPSIPPSDGRCLFFSLPGELRNMVYGYALTMENELNCVWEGSYTNGERAWRYTFTDKPPPKTVAGTRGTSWGHPASFNQLKYICHQLHAETVLFGVEDNVLAFPPSNMTNAAKAFTSFIQSRSPSLQNRIRKVILYEDRRLCELFKYSGISGCALKLMKGEPVPSCTDASMYDFCCAHPKAAFLLRFDYIGYVDFRDYDYRCTLHKSSVLRRRAYTNRVSDDPYLEDTLAWVLYAQGILEKPLQLEESIGELANVTLMLAHFDIADNLFGDSGLLDNFRVSLLGGFFDEARIRKGLSERGSHDDPLTSEQIEERVKLLRRVYEERI